MIPVDAICIYNVISRETNKKKKAIQRDILKHIMEKSNGILTNVYINHRKTGKKEK